MLAEIEVGSGGEVIPRSLVREISRQKALNSESWSLKADKPSWRYNFRHPPIYILHKQPNKFYSDYASLRFQ